jgi:hypothetical protein
MAETREPPLSYRQDQHNQYALQVPCRPEGEFPLRRMQTPFHSLLAVGVSGHASPAPVRWITQLPIQTVTHRSADHECEGEQISLCLAVSPFTLALTSNELSRSTVLKQRSMNPDAWPTCHPVDSCL